MFTTPVRENAFPKKKSGSKTPFFSQVSETRFSAFYATPVHVDTRMRREKRYAYIRVGKSRWRRGDCKLFADRLSLSDTSEGDGDIERGILISGAVRERRRYNPDPTCVLYWVGGVGRAQINSLCVIRLMLMRVKTGF